LARRQRGRIPEGAPRSGTAKDLPEYDPKEAAGFAAARMAGSGKSGEDLAACFEAAYEGAPRPVEITGYMAGQPILGDPGPPPPGEKRKLPPPPAPDQGGAPAGWSAA
ncbi:MAG: hypothetical protein O2807_13980, partial [bacterium]|nr:hypothetical protein [bacterium]